MLNRILAEGVLLSISGTGQSTSCFQEFAHGVISRELNLHSNLRCHTIRFSLTTSASSNSSLLCHSQAGRELWAIPARADA
jgi:hypothetical protein